MSTSTSSSLPTTANCPSARPHHFPVRTARPSEVYRLPEHQQPPAPREPQPPPRPRRFPIWVGVAGLLAVVLVASGLVRGTGQANPGGAPLVDIVSEDQAIAALALYGAQATTVADLQERSDIYATPGPRDAARAVERGLAKTQHALDAARELPGADPLATAYWNAQEHTAVLRVFDQVRAEASAIALLAATHDTLYSGTGSIPLADAYDLITGAFSGQPWPEPLAAWAHALIEQMEDRNRVAEAAAARAAVGELWKGRVAALKPAAVPALLDYVNGLPGTTVQGLRGHPVAGPALKQLESEQRLVSTASSRPWLGA